MKTMKSVGPIVIIALISSALFGRQTRLASQRLLIDYRDKGFIRSISDFETYKGDLFVVDNESSVVLRFKIGNGTLSFVGNIGKPGQGPGDLDHPLAISIWNGVIAIRDQSGISFFDTDGSFINKFRLFSPTLSFVFVGGRIYCITPKTNAANLIEVYSNEGKMLASFGDKKIIIPEFDNEGTANPLLNERTVFDGKLVADSNNLYYINRRYGKLIKYSFSGIEIAKANIAAYFGDNEESIKRENEKLFMEQDFWAHSKRCPEYFVFRDVRIEGGRLYFLSDLFNISQKKQGQTLKIVCIDAGDLRHAASYEYLLTQSPNLFLFFLSVLTEGKAATFLIDILSEGDFIFYWLKPAKSDIGS